MALTNEELSDSVISAQERVFMSPYEDYMRASSRADQIIQIGIHAQLERIANALEEAGNEK